MREIDLIAAALKRRRKYASFFDWPGKRLKELGIVEEFIESVSARGYMLCEPRTHEPDPPDCVCGDAAGNSVALEVVELVSQDAVERNARGENIYRWWEPEDIRVAIESLLQRKDEKTFHGGPYADIAVVIHTDEPVLMADEVREALKGITFGPFEKITRAYVLFSYMPGKGYEAIEVSVAAPNNALEQARDA